MTSGRALIAALFIACAAAVAPAASAAEDEAARYSMSQTKDGFLRLDRQTGQVSHCSARGTDWACESVADDRVAYEAEIARLTRENDALKEELQEATGEMPSEEEVDKVFSFFESFAKRFARAARIFRNEMESAREEPPVDEDGGT